MANDKNVTTMSTNTSRTSFSAIVLMAAPRSGSCSWCAPRVLGLLALPEPQRLVDAGQDRDGLHRADVTVLVGQVRSDHAVDVRLAGDEPLRVPGPGVVQLVRHPLVHVLVRRLAHGFVGRHPTLVEVGVDLRVVEVVEVHDRATVEPHVEEVGVTTRVVAPAEGVDLT